MPCTGASDRSAVQQLCGPHPADLGLSEHRGDGGRLSAAPGAAAAAARPAAAAAAPAVPRPAAPRRRAAHQQTGADRAGRVREAAGRAHKQDVPPAGRGVVMQETSRRRLQLTGTAKDGSSIRWMPMISPSDVPGGRG